MMSWTLKYGNTEKPLSDWGLSELKRTRVNQGADKVTFIANGVQLEQQPHFEPETMITINKNEKRWFYGIVSKIPGIGSVHKEEHQYEIAGPWWHLENLVYQQGWNELVPVGDKEVIRKIHTGRVILGQNGLGKPINNGEQIKQILQYAMDQGAPLAIGEIGVDVIFPYDETRDVSCAEAIQRLLRWSPDTVVWFDYDCAGHPIINIKRRAALCESVLNIKENNCIKRLEVAPRHDIRSSAVVIKYEKENRENGQSWLTTEVDAWPVGATGREFKALVLTVELDGSQSQKMRQEIKVDPIVLESAEWWQKHLPALASIPIDKIRIGHVSRMGRLPFELVEGSISAWMQRDVETDVIRGKLSYETENEHVIDREIAIRLQTTNAGTRVYEQTMSTSSAEESPVGLAKKLYEAVSELQHDGEVMLESEEIESGMLMGSVLNIVGGSKDWNTMRGLIQKVKEDVDKGRTTITFGPSKHLGADDMVELLRVNRKRQATRNADRRITGRASGSSVIEQPTHGRIENSDTGPGFYGKMVLKHEESEKKIILDTKQMKEEVVMEIKEEYYCENGNLKKRMILASDAYDFK